eukprot:2192222-Pyramimonas_sp.AAC.1
MPEPESQFTAQPILAESARVNHRTLALANTVSQCWRLVSRQHAICGGEFLSGGVNFAGWEDRILLKQR